VLAKSIHGHSWVAGEPIVLADALLRVAGGVEEPLHRLGVELPSLLRRPLATVTAEGAAEDMTTPPGVEDPAAVEALSALGLRGCHGWRMYRSRFQASALPLYAPNRRFSERAVLNWHPPLRRYADPTLRWTSRQRQIASIVCLVAALVALIVLDVSWLFWVFVVASLALAAIDLWEKRRLSR
jgi:hypothetical protein